MRNKLLLLCVCSALLSHIARAQTPILPRLDNRGMQLSPQWQTAARTRGLIQALIKLRRQRRAAILFHGKANVPEIRALDRRIAAVRRALMKLARQERAQAQRLRGKQPKPRVVPPWPRYVAPPHVVTA